MERIRTSSRLLAAVVACVCALLLACAFAPQPAHASSAKNIRLTEGKTYTNYDVTGDGKADSFRYELAGYGVGQFNSYGYHEIMFYVNGKAAGSMSSSYSFDEVIDLSFMVTKKGIPFVSVDWDAGSVVPISEIYKYKSGRFIKVLDCLKTGARCVSATASGNSIVVDGANTDRGIGTICYKFSCKYRKGKLVRSATTSNFYVLRRVSSDGFATKHAKTMTTCRSIQIYKNAKCTKKAFKLGNNQKVTFKRLRPTTKCLSIKLRTSAGKSGWFKVSTKKEQFKNTMMTG